MSVLVYTESEDGKFKKGALEAASYAKGIAQAMSTSLTAITFNVEDTSELGTYGVDKILSVSNDKLKDFNADAYADAIEQRSEERRVGKD